jgi:glycosyltransferase involved in cell wall biosynthesis
LLVAMNRLRILFLTSEYPPRVGGVASHVAELARALRAQDTDVTVIAPPWPGADEYDRAHPDTVVRYTPRIRAQPFYEHLLARWCRHYLRRNPHTLIHVHGVRPLRAALSLGVPVIFTNHTSGVLKTVATGGRRLRRLEGIVSQCAHVIAPSEELVDAARCAGFRGPATYIPNGVDAERFCPGTGEAQRLLWKIGEKEVAAVVARRLVAKNGVLIAAEAARYLDADVRVVFVGDGPERTAMERVLRTSDPTAHVHLCGSVANDAMPDVYRAADLCVLPSLMEATSIAGLEAMACARPLVGSAVGGIPALIDHGRTGLLVPPGDPRALAQAINELARDAARRAALGAAGRVRVLAEFAWPRIAARTLAVYHAVLADPAREPQSTGHA